MMEAARAMVTGMNRMMMMMSQRFVKGFEWVRQSPSTTLLWTSFGFVSATTLVLLSFVRLKLRKPDTILLTGFSGSGKTVIFYQLRDGCSKQETVQSQEPNEERFILHSETSWNSKVRPVHVIDLPRNSNLKRFLRKAAGIVFVVDATEILWNSKSVSKYLYEILTNSIVVEKKIPLLILCNKTDKLTAHSKEFIASLLEKEIDKLCSSRTSISDSNTLNKVASGTARKEFLFSDCQTQVTVSEASGLTGDISQLEFFVRKYVKY